MSAGTPPLATAADATGMATVTGVGTPLVRCVGTGSVTFTNGQHLLHMNIAVSTYPGIRHHEPLGISEVSPTVYTQYRAPLVSMAYGLCLAPRVS